MSETKFKILFVCIGNSCRSPMAEAFAAAKHGDLIDASSAGIAPASIIQPLTFSCMREKGIAIDPDTKPVALRKTSWKSLDLIVNMSGHGILGEIPKYQGNLLIWDVADPMGRPVAAYRDARDRIEVLVDRLADMLRKRQTRGERKLG